MKIINIVKGFKNYIDGTNQDLSKNRIEICKQCPISHSEKDYKKFSNRCLKGKGGCACFLPAKTAVLEEACPKRIWYNETIDMDRLNSIREKFNK